jgi:glucosamine--fructose-6-phosphate aminotransferase (isomerizing)
MVARYLIEGWSRLPTIVEVASEYRYRDPVVGPNDLVVAISQSGETADTLAAVELAKAHGATVLAICNVVGSAIPRLADHCVYTHAGPEIGVASTKAFTTQLAVLALLALHLGRRTGHLDANSCRVLIGELAALPGQVSRALAAADDVRTVAEKYQQAPAYMFLGRSEHFPIALEGALKLKEISYLPAEGHAAGEMKHGPIARVDASLPIVALVTRDRVRDKMLSNLCEVRARAGRIIAITSDDGDAITEVAHDIIAVPELVSELQPVISSIPVQLLAYHTADLLGHDIDKPRNLAKSVTVE